MRRGTARRSEKEPPRRQRGKTRDATIAPRRSPAAGAPEQARVAFRRRRRDVADAPSRPPPASIAGRWAHRAAPVVVLWQVAGGAWRRSRPRVRVALVRRLGQKIIG